MIQLFIYGAICFLTVLVTTQSTQGIIVTPENKTKLELAPPGSHIFIAIA